jgi:hypothetical protein
VKHWQSVCVRQEKPRKPRISNLSSRGYKTTVSESMEWCQVVKLPSATIPCFFLLLFIRGKRQGLNLRKNRLIAGLIETKARCVRRKNASTIAFGNGFQIFVPFSPCFLFPPFVPLFPLQPLLPPIIPLTSSVLPFSLPVCLARPRALYALARALTEPGVP